MDDLRTTDDQPPVAADADAAGDCPAWPADRVERRPTASLVAYARNARLHSDEQVEQLMASIREWGWTNPVLVDESGMIIAGHGRVLAAQRLGYAEIPVMVARGWSEEQKRAYVIADNKLAEKGKWDDGLLGDELAALAEQNFNVELTGVELRAFTPSVEPQDAVLKRVAVDRIDDQFWLSVSGPLEHQAEALAAFKALSERLPEVKVEIGTVQRDAR